MQPRRPAQLCRSRNSLRGLACLMIAASLRAQDSIPAVGMESASIHGARGAPNRPAASAGPGLPIWHYQIVSPVNEARYEGYMVGASPFERGSRTTTIPVILIPFIVQFQNTTTGFSTTFDPTTAPDAGCTAGQTAMSIVENSPIFQNYPWTLNGINVGVTQYIDAFQRSNFWRYLQNENGYHTLLTYAVAEPLLLPLSYSSATLAAG